MNQIDPEVLKALNLDQAVIDEVNRIRSNPKLRAAAKEQLEQAKAQNSLVEFGKRVWPWFEAPKHIIYLADLLERAERGEIKRLAISIAPGHGKLIADDTPVPTPDGWKNHGDLKPGDVVYGVNGDEISIVAVSEPSMATLDVELSDGSIFTVHPNHEWMVDLNYRGNKIFETHEIAKRIAESVNPRSDFCLPPTNGILGSHQGLLLDPYVLGAWLGDGTYIKPCITHHVTDTAVIEKVSRIYGIRSVVNVNDGNTKCTYFSELREDLKAAGVFGNKHIPNQYLRASREQRLELLAGLIDTDGNVAPRTEGGDKVRVICANERLASGIVELIRSLGWRVSDRVAPPCTSSSGIVGKKPVHVIGFVPDCAIPTVLPRKFIGGNLRRSHRRLTIKSIKQSVNLRAGRCVQVSSADGLYLVGKSMIPTHNSSILQAFVAWFLGRSARRRILALSATQDLAKRNSFSMREIVRSERWPWPGVKLVGESLEEWQTSEMGGVRAIGQTGTVTGFRAEMVLCLDRKQIVYAKRGAVEAETLSLNDRVLTRGGTYERIVGLRTREAKRLKITMRGFPGFPITCSEEHPFLLKNGTWKNASELEIGDRIVRPKTKSIEAVPDGFPETEAFWEFVGWILAEGSLKTYTLRLSIHVKEIPIITALCDRLGFKSKATTTAGLGAFVTVTGIPTNLKKWLHSLHLGPFNKAIPSEIHNLPPTLKAAFVRGWLEGDGTSRLNKRNQWEANITTVSAGMAASLRLLLCELGINASLCSYEREFHGKLRPTYRVFFKQGGLNALYPGKYPSGRHASYARDPLESTVTKIEDAGIGEVVSLAIENDPTICVPGAVTHNCDDVQPDAGTDTYRKELIDWFQQVLSTRLEPSGIAVVIQTRWHDMDLIGALSRGESRDMWHIVNIPVYAGEKDEEFGRAPGEVLWPERWTQELIKEKQIEVGPAGFAAQYMGDPVPAAGTIFEKAWLEHKWEKLPTGQQATISDEQRILNQYSGVVTPRPMPYFCIQACDSAWKTSTTADRSAIVTLVSDGINIYIADLWVGRAQYTDLRRILVEQYKLWLPSRLYVEEAASGFALVDDIRRATNIPIIGIKPGTDSKISRAESTTGLWEAGRVLLPESSATAAWVHDLKSEFLRFPFGAHDDIVDAVTLGLRQMRILQGNFNQQVLDDYASQYSGFMGR